MPTSKLGHIPIVLRLIAEVPHDAVLDIGPGVGKYGLLMREYWRSRPTRLDAIEAWEPYLVEYPWLDHIYDTLRHGDAAELSAQELDGYDVVLMADVLEHFTKEVGTELLGRIPGRVIITTPAVYFQNPEAATIWTEDHRSLWERQDFQRLGRDVEHLEKALNAWVVRLGPLP